MPRSKLCPLFSIMSEGGVQHCRDNCAWYIIRERPGAQPQEDDGECAIFEIAEKMLSR